MRSHWGSKPWKVHEGASTIDACNTSSDHGSMGQPKIQGAPDCLERNADCGGAQQWPTRTRALGRSLLCSLAPIKHGLDDPVADSRSPERHEIVDSELKLHSRRLPDLRDNDVVA